MKLAIAGLLAVLAAVLLVIWWYARRDGRAGADETAPSVTPDRAPSTARSAAVGARKHPVPAFDDSPALRAQIDELTKEREARKRKEEQKCVTSVTLNCPFLTPSQAPRAQHGHIIGERRFSATTVAPPG